MSTATVAKPTSSDLAQSLLLDSTKVGWYKDRIEAWKRGERIAPVTIDCAMTRACNYACSFCVHPESLIEMADGSRKAMVNVRRGDKILSVDSLGDLTVSTVKHQWKTSNRAEVISIVTGVGNLRCTRDHLVMTKGGHWVPAGQLREGQYVYTSRQTECGVGKAATRGEAQRSVVDVQCADETPYKDVNRQPYEEAWSGRQGGSDKKGALRGRLLLEAVQTAGTRGQTQGAYAVRGGASSLQQADEREQPYAQTGGRRQGPLSIHRGEEEGGIRAHEEDLEGREDYTEYVLGQREREAGKQDRVPNTLRCLRDGSEVYGQRNVLDSRDNKRYTQEPRLCVREWQGEDGTTGTRKVLAQGSREGRRGAARLHGSRMERVHFVDREDTHQEETASSEGEDRCVAGLCRIERIERAGVSAVYDLECFPHHNFVADGVVVHNCYAQLQANEGAKITKTAFFSFLDDAAEIGVKGVSFISDGESTIVPWYADAVEHAASLGLAVGAGSNGLRLTKPVLERVLPHLSYLRFNFSAGERKRYAEIMGVPQEYYDTVIDNILDGMEIIRRDNLKCSLNMQLVCDPKDGDQVIPFAKLVAKLRPVYGIIKHCADNIEGDLGVDYSKYDGLVDSFKEAEQIGKDAGVRLDVKWGRLDGKRTYTKCYGPPFILQVSGSGLVSTCGFHFNEKYKKFHMGSICCTRFKDIWSSDRYMEIMQYLGSDHFNPQKRCGPNCLQHNTCTFLFDHLHRGKPLPIAADTPRDMEFL